MGLFMVVLVADLIVVVIYYRKLRELFEYASVNNEKLFGLQYRTFSEMLLDQNFLNKLLAGDWGSFSHGENVSGYLVVLRRLFMVQLAGAGALLLVGFLSAINGW